MQAPVRSGIEIQKDAFPWHECGLFNDATPDSPTVPPSCFRTIVPSCKSPFSTRSVRTSTYVHAIEREPSRSVVKEITLPLTINREWTIKSVSSSITAVVAPVGWAKTKTRKANTSRRAIVMQKRCIPFNLLGGIT